MNKVYQIYYIGISNFLDRIRDKSTIIITLFMMYISYLFFPEKNASIYFSLNVSKDGFFYRGIYNSTWLGWISTMMFITTISLIGFYFTNNSIKRERNLKIGEITASMPMRSYDYIFGKAFGNFLFLLLQMGVVILITIIMQFVRGESYSFEILKFLRPFLLLGIPICIIISVIAIMFENLPFLSGTLGNVVYFFVWSFLSVASMMTANKGSLFFTDIFGIKAISKIIEEQFKNAFNELQDLKNFSIGNSGTLHGNIKTFVIDKVDFNFNIILERFLWIGVAIFVLCLISIIFRRNLLIIKKVSKKDKKVREDESYKHIKNRTLTPIINKRSHSNDLNIIKGELELLLKSAPIWWYGAIVFLSFVILFSKGDSNSKTLIPIMWILPLFIWSKLGAMQRNFNMEGYLFTYKNYRISQLIDSFIAGYIFTLIINLGVIIKFISNNNFKGVLYILMGAFFITAFGIFIGNSIGSSTVFEIIYIILWYIGMLNGMPYLDFLGLTQDASNMNIPIIFSIFGVVALGLSFLARSNRIKNLYN
ncbi:hypothetical protein SAMN02745163_01557 [Clostridium cavendishii DSM 21758]|uniref:Uncharacterized protein n=1 Tax=Clostridium cavendishii DSM 21758 TaxID=1121302 RepID=A0A1M6HRP0_9CLOT|nr:hypothetical protein [Clostridium cavendishii]SHJ24851.1 hypothetical protein SAMN02745163_01557 [Clostridium cavendishii DSM 21758]